MVTTEKEKPPVASGEPKWGIETWAGSFRRKYSNCNVSHYKVISIFNSHPEIEAAEDAIWSWINSIEGPEAAEVETPRCIKWLPKFQQIRHEAAVEKWSRHGTITDERWEGIQERRLIRNFAGNATVEALKKRRRNANLAFASAARPFDKILMDNALKCWAEDFRAIEKEFYRLSEHATQARLMNMQKANNTPSSEKKGRKTAFSIPDNIDANRNTTLHQVACSLFAKNLSPEGVWAALAVENNTKCYEPLPERELRDLFKSAEKYHRRNQLERQSGVAVRFTDMANADRLVEEYGDIIRYVPAYKKWLIFNGSRWEIGNSGEIFPYVRGIIEKLYQWAQLSLSGESAEKALKRIAELEDLHKQKSMIEMTATIPAIRIEPSQLDSDIYMMNLHNGTLDLRTGLTRMHSPEDYISKLSPVKFDAGATCPTWEAFLDVIMGGNQNLIRFLQRAIGYSLTGDTREQCIFFLYGSGANGKSTILNCIKALLGDYAMQAAPDILLAKDRHGGASNDLARLPGARILVTSETEDGQKFAEAALKQMTGQDTITARFLYAEFFEYRPQFKIWFATNHKPIVKGTDAAFWRRIHLIPFSVTIPPEKQDRELEKKLLNELPGILNWVIAGCLEWLRNGLQPPDEVRAAVSEYRKDMDVFSQWLEACCILKPGVRTSARELYESYKAWSEENTGWKMSQTKFGRTLSERGFFREFTPYATWHGIGLRSGDF